MHACKDAAQCIHDASCARRPEDLELGLAGSERTHHDIEAAEEFDSLVYRRLYVRLLANICLNCGGLDIGEALLNECEGLLGRGKIDVDKQDVGALLGEEQRRLESNAPGWR